MVLDVFDELFSRIIILCYSLIYVCVRSCTIICMYYDVVGFFLETRIIMFKYDEYIFTNCMLYAAALMHYMLGVWDLYKLALSRHKISWVFHCDFHLWNYFLCAWRWSPIWNIICYYNGMTCLIASNGI